MSRDHEQRLYSESGLPLLSRPADLRQLTDPECYTILTPAENIFTGHSVPGPKRSIVNSGDIIALGHGFALRPLGLDSDPPMSTEAIFRKRRGRYLPNVELLRYPSKRRTFDLWLPDVDAENSSLVRNNFFLQVVDRTTGLPEVSEHAIRLCSVAEQESDFNSMFFLRAVRHHSAGGNLIAVGIECQLKQEA